MTPQVQQRFLRALASGCTVSEAATAAGVSSGAAYALRRCDADFAEAWRLALEDSADVLEAEARRRAIDGVEEPVVYQGQLTPVWERDEYGNTVTRKVRRTVEVKGEPVEVEVDEPVQARNPDGSLKYLTIRKPSDALLALLLKGRRKDVFAERRELTGANGEPLNVEMSTTQRAARLAAILAAARERKDMGIA